MKNTFQAKREFSKVAQHINQQSSKTQTKPVRRYNKKQGCIYSNFNK